MIRNRSKSISQFLNRNRSQKKLILHFLSTHCSAIALSAMTINTIATAYIIIGCCTINNQTTEEVAEKTIYLDILTVSFYEPLKIKKYPKAHYIWRVKNTNLF